MDLNSEKPGFKSGPNSILIGH
jgi:hypothetical protein